MSERKEIINIFNNKPFTMIPNIFIKEVDGEECILSEKQLAISLIIYMTRSGKDVCIFSINKICEILGITYSTRIKSIIIETLKQLQSEEQIFFRDNIFLDDKYEIKNLNKIKANDIIFGELINHMNSDFCMVCDSDIQKIIEYSINNEIDLFLLLKHYTYICSCINKEKDCEDYLLAYPSFDTISKVCGIKSKNTIVRYNEIFKELKIFHFDYAGYVVDRKGKESYRNSRMFYTTYGNEDLLIERLRKDREKNGYYKINGNYKELINLQISISKKITNINKINNKTKIDLENLKLLEQEKENLIELVKQEKQSM